MLAYSIRRLFTAVVILLVASIVIFWVCSSFMNPTNALIGHGKPLSATEIANIKHTYWLDQPRPERYWHWLTGLVLHGRWGPSVQNSNVGIGHEIWHRLGVTSRLVGLAMILAAILAIIVGSVSAIKQYSITDYTLSFSGFLFLSLPAFWFAILLKQVGIKWVNEPTGHQVFATFGERSFGPNGGSFTDILSHIVLPTITLALISFAAWSRYNRASMLEVLNSDYVRLARAKGLRRGVVLRRHALRTALIPMTTVVALDVAAIFGGAIVTETVFQWHGMGDYLVTSIKTQDQFAVLAWLLVSGFIIIMFNLLADLLYAVLDPRIRFE